MKKTLLTIIGLTAMASSAMFGQVIAAWDTTGLSGTTAGPLAASTRNTNVASASLDRGAGLTATSLNNGFAASGWADSKATAISGNDFFIVTIAAPAAGYEMSFSSIDLNFRNTSTGVRSMQWQYSLDGFATAGIDLGSTFTLPGSTTVADYGPVDLTGITALQNVTTSVSFRLLGWNDTGNLAPAGTGAIGNSTGNNLVFSGVVAIPEPSAAILLGLGAMAIFLRRKLASPKI